MRQAFANIFWPSNAKNLAAPITGLAGFFLFLYIKILSKSDVRCRIRKESCPHVVLNNVYGNRRLAPTGGDNMVTWDALTCVFTFGLLLVAVIAFVCGKKK